MRPPLRAATYEALFGLLAVSGMRLGEAIGLERDDVDLDAGVVTIRHAKFDRSRLVPLHPSTTDALRGYAARGTACARGRARSVLPLQRRHPLDRSGVHKTFVQLTTALGLRTATVRPRIHDLRHSFAVHTLIRWQRSGVSSSGHIGALSTYLGHVNPAGTYWYLSAAPELMAARRRPPRRAVRRTVMSALAPTLQAFFTDRLIGQRAASPNTIAAYRDTFRLLLGFASDRTGKTPSALDIADLDAPLIAAFLDHLEHDRHNSVRDPQRPPRRDPLAVRLRRPAPPRARRHHPAGAGHPAQTLRAQPAHLPHRAGGRRAARRLRPDHLDRPARPRHARARRPDRAAGLRARPA